MLININKCCTRVTYVFKTFCDNIHKGPDAKNDIKKYNKKNNKNYKV